MIQMLKKVIHTRPQTNQTKPTSKIQNRDWLLTKLSIDIFSLNIAKTFTEKVPYWI